MIVEDIRLSDLVRDPSSWLPKFRGNQLTLLRTSLPSMDCDSYLLVSQEGHEFSLRLWTGQAYVDWLGRVKTESGMRGKFRAELKTVGKTPSTTWWGVLGYEDSATAKAPGRLDDRIAQSYLIPKCLSAEFLDLVAENDQLQAATRYSAGVRGDVRHPGRDISEGTRESALVQSMKAQLLLGVWPDERIAEAEGPLLFLQEQAQEEARASHEALEEVISQLMAGTPPKLKQERFGISGATLSWPFPPILASNRRTGEEVVRLRAEFIARSALPHFFFQLALHEPGAGGLYQQLQPFDALNRICTITGEATAGNVVRDYLESMRSTFPVLATNPFANRLFAEGWCHPTNSPFDRWLLRSANQ